jgi:hypothetical protein
VLILPPGHAAKQTRPLVPLGLRERRLIAVIGSLAVVLIVVTIVALATAGHSSGNGCVDLKLAYSTGGAEIYQCGAKARATCTNLSGPNGITGLTRNAVTSECRKAGLPVG